MATLVNSGRAAIAASIKDRLILMGWGTGNAAWDNTPVAETVDKTVLVAPAGYRKATEKSFVSPDPAGAIVVPTGRFSLSANPTNHLYLRFTFDFEDSSSAAIRETGVFIDAVLQGGLPPGQMFFSVAEVTNPGIMLLAENVAKITRTPATRESFEFVVTF